LNIALNMSCPADDVRVRIYTASFRKVLDERYGSPSANRIISIQAPQMARLRSGTYYIEVLAQAGNRKAKRVSVLIILK
jgi:hypothetical protein